MTTLHITVGDRESLRKDTLQFVQTVEANDRDDRADRHVLQFGSYDDLVETLTPLRLELLEAIAEHQPQSMRETARLVDRDVSDVHSDLKHLETIGVLEFEEGGPGGAMQPIMPYDKIEIHIDHPLLDRADLDDASAQV